MKRVGKVHWIVAQLLFFIIIFGVNCIFSIAGNILGQQDLFCMLGELANAIICTILVFKIFKENLVFRFSLKSFLKQMFVYGFHIIVFAIIMFSYIYTINREEYFFELETQSYLVICGGILFFIIAAIREEIACRALSLNYIERYSKKGRVFAIIISSIFFGVGHFTNIGIEGNTLEGVCSQMIFASLSGIFYAAIYVYGNRSVWAVSLLHALWNIVIYLYNYIIIVTLSTEINVLSLFGGKLLIQNIDNIFIALNVVIGILIIVINEHKLRKIEYIDNQEVSETIQV